MAANRRQRDELMDYYRNKHKTHTRFTEDQEERFGFGSVAQRPPAQPQVTASPGGARVPRQAVTSTQRPSPSLTQAPAPSSKQIPTPSPGGASSSSKAKPCGEREELMDDYRNKHKTHKRFTEDQEERFGFGSVAQRPPAQPQPPASPAGARVTGQAGPSTQRLSRLPTQAPAPSSKKK